MFQNIVQCLSLEVYTLKLVANAPIIRRRRQAARAEQAYKRT